jgi:hypothetical protein
MKIILESLGTYITPEARFNRLDMHFENIWTQMALELKFKRSQICIFRV